MKESGVETWLDTRMIKFIFKAHVNHACSFQGFGY